MAAMQAPTRPRAGRWIFWAYLALAAFYLITEHRAHLAGALRWLPLGLFLLCPLMHMFGHGDGGHGGHGGHGGDSGDGDRDRARGALPELTDAAAKDERSDRLHGGR